MKYLLSMLLLLPLSVQAENLTEEMSIAELNKRMEIMIKTLNDAKQQRDLLLKQQEGIAIRLDKMSKMVKGSLQVAKKND